MISKLKPLIVVLILSVLFFVAIFLDNYFAKKTTITCNVAYTKNVSNIASPFSAPSTFDGLLVKLECEGDIVESVTDDSRCCSAGDIVLVDKIDSLFFGKDKYRNIRKK